MVEFNLNIIALDFDKNLEKLSEQAEENLKAAIEGTAAAAYANIIAKAQAELGSTRQNYLKDLSFTQVDDLDYIIRLKDHSFAEALEEGFTSFNLGEELLRSTSKVSAGPRVGEPWVQQGKNGKYAVVPIKHKPYARAGGSAELRRTIRQMTAFNSQGLRQRLTQAFTDPSGAPLEGKVAVGRSSNPYLDKLTKYQQLYCRDGEVRVQSLYIAFRTVSENGKAWMHPGFRGLKAFVETEAWVEAELKQIMENL